MSNRISFEAATNTLQRFYANASSDYISVEDIYASVDRAGKPIETNRNWLYNTMSNLKPHNLVETVYGVKNNVRVTQGIRLTAEGRRALKDKVGSNAGPKLVTSDSRVTFASVRADVKVLRELYPEFEVVFDARLREDD